MKNKLTPNEILAQLCLFNGSENFYKHPLFKDFIYTDGVKFVAEQCEAYWLIDAIASNISHIKKFKLEEFVSIELKVFESKGQLIFDNGNRNVFYFQEIPFTDFPLESIKFFFTNGVLLLPSEN